MRKIVYYIATSIDGFIAHKDGGVAGFLMEGDHADDFIKSFEHYDTVIMGRGTYEFGFQFGLEPGEPAYPGLKHIVISGLLDFPDNEDVVLVKDNALVYIRQLKQGKGKDIWLCGGGNVAGQLITDGLIDEVILKVNPIALGSGIRVFEQLREMMHLKLMGTKTYASGVVLLHYAVLADKS